MRSRPLVPPVLLFLLLATSAEAAPRRRAIAPTPPDPPCSMITGTGAVTFTHDEGRTLAPAATPLHGIAYTYGLVTLDAPDTVMAFHQDQLLMSTDAGCSWRVVATIPGADFPPRLTAARGSRVYAWSDARQWLARWDARGAVTLKAPAAFVGFEADANNADFVRGAADDGGVWESRDAGESWTRIATIPALSIYRAAFDPTDLNRIVAGTLAGGAVVSFDGGRTWALATGLPSRANVFNVVISPVNHDVVWTMGLDLADSSRHIYLSRDGGRSYTRVVDAGGEVTLINGPTMAAHPANPDVLYFVFGTYFQGYGTDLYRYDAASRTVTKTHSEQHDINAIAFDREHPSLMYLGLEREER